jgi:hypothetical protein
MSYHPSAILCGILYFMAGLANVSLATAGSISLTPVPPDVGDQNWKHKLHREKAPPIKADPFSSRVWGARPMSPSAAAAQAAVPPPFPFQFVGKMSPEGGAPKLFLVRGEDLYAIAAGEALPGAYRVDEIGDVDFTVTYLPLQRQQRFAYSAASALTTAIQQGDGVPSAPPGSARWNHGGTGAPGVAVDTADAPDMPGRVASLPARSARIAPGSNSARFPRSETVAPATLAPSPPEPVPAPWRAGPPVRFPK